MKITVCAHKQEIEWSGRTARCSIGRNGAIPIGLKKEGDGATPLGNWPLRLVYFRPDRLNAPETSGLSTVPLEQNDGWCDEIDCPDYNHKIKLPHLGHHDPLWREDNIYDIIVPLGYNDSPVFYGKGSAIFFHIAREGYLPTAGCIAVALSDMLSILKECNNNSVMEILP